MKKINSDSSARIIQYTLVVILSCVILTGCNKRKPEEGHKQYTCPMHPDIVRDAPGKCPVCKMDLVEKNATAKPVKLTGKLVTLLQSPDKVVVSAIRTIQPVEQTLSSARWFTGIVKSDPATRSVVSARTSGRVGRVYVHSNFQRVAAGDKILDMYSPELTTIQNELSYLMKHDSTNTTLLEATRSRLLLLGLSRQQIAKLNENGPYGLITVYSPASGYVQQPPGAAVPIREGATFKAGEEILRIVRDDKKRIEVEIDQESVLSIHAGDSVWVRAGNAEPMHAAVSYVLPFQNTASPFVKAIIDIKDASLMPGQLVRVQLTQKSLARLWIPRHARAALGTTDVVFVKHHGAFRARPFVAGERIGDWVAVASGIHKDDSVAVNAHFLVDRDASVKISE